MKQRMEDYLYLENLGIGPIIYRVGEDYIIMEKMDITLKDYLKKHPELNNYFYEKTLEDINLMYKDGLYDGDFRLENIMLNPPNLKLYWIDPNLIEIDEEYQELLDYIPIMFNIS